MCPNWGSIPQLRYVPCLGIKLVTFQSTGWRSNQLNHTSQSHWLHCKQVLPFRVTVALLLRCMQSSSFIQHTPHFLSTYHYASLGARPFEYAVPSNPPKGSVSYMLLIPFLRFENSGGFLTPWLMYFLLLSGFSAPIFSGKIATVIFLN